MRNYRGFMRIALCQIPVSSNPGVNLGRVSEALREAAADGADLAVFPEATLTRFGSDLRAVAEPLAEPLEGPFCWGLAAAAKETGVALIAGVFEPAPDGRVYNTAVVIDGDGGLVASTGSCTCSTRSRSVSPISWHQDPPCWWHLWPACPSGCRSATTSGSRS
jgi:hypothetical protein